MPSDGVCNGTRLVVREISNDRRRIICEHIGGSRKGQRMIIPRIRMISKKNQYPYDWERVQFPLRLA